MSSPGTYICAIALIFAALSASCTDLIENGEMEGSPPVESQVETQSGRASASAASGVKALAIARMQDAIRRYERIADQGGWPTVSEEDSAARVVSLRRLLTVTGDLPESASQESDSVYSQSLVRAITQFQARHGLRADGEIGPMTLAAMNTPVEARLEQLRINLRRLHALPDSMGQRFVLVNIPEFKLRAYENEEAVQEMAVIVGEQFEDQQTPRFSDEMEYIIFRPFWNVPDRIAADEIVPEARRDPRYLGRNHYEITSNWGPDAEIMEVTPENLDRVEEGELKIRQTPGRHNALGLVKFMFPNPYAVYLHGTPADHLFGEQTRAFSHGCIRVERPVDLAEFVLRNQPEWTRSKIEEAMNTGDSQQVDLDSAIPVHVVYLTAYVDDTGAVRFFEDVYGLGDDGLPAVDEDAIVEDPNAMDAG